MAMSGITSKINGRMPVIPPECSGAGGDLGCKMRKLEKSPVPCPKTRSLPKMKQPRSKWMPLFSAAIVVAMFATWPVQAELMEKTRKVGDTTVHYKVVLPSEYDPAKAYPAILAFGGGPQTMNVVDNVLNRNFRAEAEKRGYIVVAPAAPDDEVFFEEGARIFPEFLKMILADYKIQDNKFHIAGPSNGGIAAFHVAAANPQYFLSVTAFPGYMWQPNTAKIQAISKMCVFMYVGENDPYMWHAEMKKEAELLRSKGTVAHYTVEKGQPHRLDTLAGVNAARLFDGFEETKKGCSK
jgi:predicted esterase